MGSVGSLYVSINANDDSLRKSMKKTEESLLSFKNVVKTLAIAEVFNLGVEAVKEFGRAIIDNTKDAFKEIAVITKLSERIGISTENLVGYADAAEDAGIELETFATSLTKLFQNLGGADEESGKAAEALGRMGLKLSDLTMLSDNDKLLKLAEAFGTVEGSANKLSVAMALFGKSGAGWVNMLKNGKEGLKDSVKEMTNLGKTFSNFEGGNVLAANLAIDDMLDLWKAVGVAIAVLVSPAITQFKNNVMDATVAGENWGTKIRTALQDISLWIADAVDTLSILRGGFHMFMLVMDSIVLTVGKLAQGFIWLQKVNPAVLLSDSLSEYVNSAVAELDKFNAETLRSAQSHADEVGKQAKNFAAMWVEGAGSARTTLQDYYAKMQADAVAAGKGIQAALEAQRFHDMVKSKTMTIIKGMAKDVAKSAIAELDPTLFMSSDSPLTSYPGGVASASKLNAQGRFQEFSLSNMSLAGVSPSSQEQKVNDPQIKETNLTLKRIETKLGSSVAVAG